MFFYSLFAGVMAIVFGIAAVYVSPWFTIMALISAFFSGGWNVMWCFDIDYGDER